MVVFDVRKNKFAKAKKRKLTHLARQAGFLSIEHFLNENDRDLTKSANNCKITLFADFCKPGLYNVCRT